MRIAIYVRKSTESEDRQVQSLDDQLKILQEIAVREGFSVVEIISESKSAKEPGQRPGFKTLIELIELGKIEGILTWHINRLTRNLVDGGQIAHLLSAGTLQMIRTPDRTFRSEDNVLLLAIENGVATSYIHDLSKAVRRGMDSKAAKGWIPGKPPVGYKNNAETREIDLDPVRAPLVRKAFEIALTRSSSVAEITREMKRLGLTGRSKKRSAKALSNAAIHKILKNPFYCGTPSYKGTIIAGAHQPLVTKSEFDLVQINLKRLGNPKHRSEIPPAFAGTFKCKECRAAIVFESKTKTIAKSGATTTYGYYHCSGSRGCKRISIRDKAVSELSKEFVDRMTISPSFAKWCWEATQNSATQESSEIRESIDETRNVLENDLQRLDTLTIRYVDGDIQKSTYLRVKSSLEQAIETRRDVLRRIENREAVAMAYIRQKLDAAENASRYEIGDQNLRRQILVSLGIGHVMNQGRIEFQADPVLQKIASFEPGNNSSQSVKSDDFLPDHQVWWTLVEDIRTIAREFPT